MAQDISLLGATYSDVPAVTLPKSGGGEATFTDVSGTTATASTILQGYGAFAADGAWVNGTLVNEEKVPYTVASAIYTLFSKATYKETGLTDELAVLAAWLESDLVE